MGLPFMFPSYISPGLYRHPWLTPDGHGKRTVATLDSVSVCMWLLLFNICFTLNFIFIHNVYYVL